MKLEYWKYEDPNNTVTSLHAGYKYSEKPFSLVVKSRTDSVSEKLHPGIKIATLHYTEIQAAVHDEEKGVSTNVSVSFRNESKIVVVVSEGDILISDFIYEFLEQELSLELEPFEPDRNRIREFLMNVQPIDVRVRTWRGEVSIDELEPSEGDPLLRYSMISAEVQIECVGEFLANVSLDYMYLHDSVTDAQRECALQFVEQYLAA